VGERLDRNHHQLIGELGDLQYHLDVGWEPGPGIHTRPMNCMSQPVDGGDGGAHQSEGREGS
jgi:hypothetical protein